MEENLDQAADAAPTNADSAPQEPAKEPMLTPVEARVLACLMEKEITTPDYYPMTINGLVTACNQKSNRSPITEWDDRIIEDALGSLRRKRLASMINMAGARVPKYKHLTLDTLNLKSSTRAVLTELMLRGVQTLGEIRTNTERMHKFAELADAESAVQGLINYTGGPLIREIPAGGGKRVKTYVHLLCGEPDMQKSAPDLAVALEVPPPPDWKADMEANAAATAAKINALNDRVERLEKMLAELVG